MINQPTIIQQMVKRNPCESCHSMECNRSYNNLRYMKAKNNKGTEGLFSERPENFHVGWYIISVIMVILIGITGSFVVSNIIYSVF